MSGGTLVDLLTDTEAKLAIGKGVLDQDKLTLLQSGITAVSLKLAECVGPVIYSTLTAELHSGGRSYVYLDKRPVQGIVQVVEYDYTTAGTLTAESNAAKPTSGYRFNATNGRVTRRSGNCNYLFPRGTDNVLITYVAGRYTQTSTVGDRYKDAARLILKNAWRAYETAAVQMGEFAVPHASFPTFITANAAKDMLADEWQSGSGVGE